MESDNLFSISERRRGSCVHCGSANERELWVFFSKMKHEGNRRASFPHSKVSAFFASHIPHAPYRGMSGRLDLRPRTCTNLRRRRMSFAKFWRIMRTYYDRQILQRRIDTRFFFSALTNVILFLSSPLPLSLTLPPLQFSCDNVLISLRTLILY